MPSAEQAFPAFPQMRYVGGGGRKGIHADIKCAAVATMMAPCASPKTKPKPYDVTLLCSPSTPKTIPGAYPHPQ